MFYIKVDDLSFHYEKEPVLTNISFELNPGDFVMLTGENGAAKTTLLRNILGLLKPTMGEVTQSPTNRYGEKLVVGYVPQQVSSFNIGFPSTVLELVQSGLYQRGKWFKKLTEADKDQVKRSLESVGLWEMRHKKIGELSGGQKQRISIARVFATDPDLFVLDEPTTGMDKKSREEFYQLLRHQSEIHEKAILMVSHDHDELRNYCNKHIELVRKEELPWRCFSMNSCRELSKPRFSSL
ncbi:metal ABC transporter ATP-binding protein [Cytobacillus sp. FSL W7-1323]|uniref:metal ABC transporter ATP-binding protein n=1 Tax=Cytobacillus TaxID=2675230 RepID=UPI0024819290|nr:MULTISPECIES: metal ABC transporter ATP-binding protein [Cytobacillus]MDQ0184406.1 zinc transport system ATP-binding protein [Cytobacillus kochii]MEA1852355.1 metal ABC transporter ATP-binding protein [Cytobacillus sp. OWB-43]MED1606899.1 metal ABC transporter ATP-binding protein [Cytobacillus kochii]